MTSAFLASLGAFTVRDRRVDHADASRLLRAFYDEQVGRYGEADPVDLEPHAYTPPTGRFVVGYLRGQPVGCVGCRWYNLQSRTVEIKKAYLVPKTRGLGLGRVLLAAVEAWAIDCGAQQAILETGVHNSAALALFVGTGYRPTARYVLDRDPAINRAFLKTLTPVEESNRLADGLASVR